MPQAHLRPDGRRLCAVNVKLTMRLGIGAGLLLSARSVFRRFSPRAGAVVTQAASDSLVVVRGGWNVTRFLAREDQHGPGRAFSEPSLFVGVVSIIQAGQT
jgi:hypothetical protein